MLSPQQLRELIDYLTSRDDTPGSLLGVIPELESLLTQVVADQGSSSILSNAQPDSQRYPTPESPRRKDKCLPDKITSPQPLNLGRKQYETQAVRQVPSLSDSSGAVPRPLSGHSSELLAATSSTQSQPLRNLQPSGGSPSFSEIPTPVNDVGYSGPPRGLQCSEQQPTSSPLNSKEAHVNSMTGGASAGNLLPLGAIMEDVDMGEVEGVSSGFDPDSDASQDDVKDDVDMGEVGDEFCGADSDTGASEEDVDMDEVQDEEELHGVNLNKRSKRGHKRGKVTHLDRRKSKTQVLRQVQASLIRYFEASNHAKSLPYRPQEDNVQSEDVNPNPAPRPNCPKRGARAVPKGYGTTPEEKDPARGEQVFYHLGMSPSVPEDQLLSDDAHRFVLELSMACKDYLKATSDNVSDNPVLQLLENAKSSCMNRTLQTQAAYVQDSVQSLALRCKLSEDNVALNSFALMMNVLHLRCEVIRQAKAKKMEKNAVLRVVKFPGPKSSAPCLATLIEYVLDGAKCCLLAGGGSIFILAFAATAKLQSKLRLMPHDVILRINYLLRSPNPENVLGKLVIRYIIPAIRKLQVSCRLSLGTFFHQALLYENLTLPETEVSELVRSDEFFDRVTFNAFIKPRNWKHWAPCWNAKDNALPTTPFQTVSRTILSLPVLTVQVPPISSATEDDILDSPLTPLPSSDGDESEERETPPPASPSTPLTTIETNYDPDLEENRKEDFTRLDDTERFLYTEKERHLADLADEPLSLEELREKLQKQLAQGVKDFGAYVKVSNDIGRGARLRVNDVNGDVIFLVYRDLPDDLRERLYDILKAIFTTKLEYADSEAAGEFLAQLAMHLGNWNKYPTHGDGYPDDQEPAASLKNKKKTSSCLPRSTHDTQRLSEIYRLLKQCLKEIFEWMKISFKETFPEDFEVICEFSENLPGDEASPVYPFSGLVVNLNVSTRIHRDFQDLRLCLVMPIMDPSCIGGDLCFKEPGIRLQMRCGDMVAFPSNRISHYNTHFKGERASLVFHTDSNGQAWVSSFNKWGPNKYLNKERIP